MKFPNYRHRKRKCPTFMPNVGGKDIDGVQICCGKFT